MKTMEELENLFKKEEDVWKEKMNDLSIKHSIIMAEINDDMTTEEVLDHIDKAMKICEKMGSLDSKHKKFLLRWIRKFRRRVTIDIFTSMFKN